MTSPLDPKNTGRPPFDENQAAILKECCGSRAPAIVFSLEDARTYYRARMISISGDLISLHLQRALPSAPAAGSPCWISFNYHGDSGAFLSDVSEYHHESPPAPLLVLKIRSCILRAEARTAYRVNVSPDSRMTVQVATRDGRIWEARALDMSVAGILIHFGSRGWPRLEIGETINLMLRLGSKAVSVRGEVRRQVGKAYGVFFLDVASRTAPPPPALRAIVNDLERQWLQERIRP